MIKKKNSYKNLKYFITNINKKGESVNFFKSQKMGVFFSF